MQDSLQEALFPVLNEFLTRELKRIDDAVSFHRQCKSLASFLPDCKVEKVRDQAWYKLPQLLTPFAKLEERATATDEWPRLTAITISNTDSPFTQLEKTVDFLNTSLYLDFLVLCIEANPPVKELNTLLKEVSTSAEENDQDFFQMLKAKKLRLFDLEQIMRAVSYFVIFSEMCKRLNDIVLSKTITLPTQAQTLLLRVINIIQTIGEHINNCVNALHIADTDAMLTVMKETRTEQGTLLFMLRKKLTEQSQTLAGESATQANATWLAQMKELEQREKQLQELTRKIQTRHREVVGQYQSSREELKKLPLLLQKLSADIHAYNKTVTRPEEQRKLIINDEDITPSYIASSVPRDEVFELARKRFGSFFKPEMLHPPAAPAADTPLAIPQRRPSTTVLPVFLLGRSSTGTNPRTSESSRHTRVEEASQPRSPLSPKADRHDPMMAELKGRLAKK